MKGSLVLNILWFVSAIAFSPEGMNFLYEQHMQSIIVIAGHTIIFKLPYWHLISGFWRDRILRGFVIFAISLGRYKKGH